MILELNSELANMRVLVMVTVMVMVMMLVMVMVMVMVIHTQYIQHIPEQYSSGKSGRVSLWGRQESLGEVVNMAPVVAA